MSESQNAFKATLPTDLRSPVPRSLHRGQGAATTSASTAFASEEIHKGILSGGEIKQSAALLMKSVATRNLPVTGMGVEHIKSDRNKNVARLSPHQIAQCKLQFFDGQICGSDGVRINTGKQKILFVMNEQGDFFAAKSNAFGLVIHHSSLAENVAGAGEVRIEHGVLKEINDVSGHFLPSLEYSKRVEQVLRMSGVDLSVCKMDFIASA